MMDSYDIVEGNSNDPIPIKFKENRQPSIQIFQLKSNSITKSGIQKNDLMRD